jgi:tetratricopeptide (TPR) repeat protein
MFASALRNGTRRLSARAPTRVPTQPGRRLAAVAGAGVGAAACAYFVLSGSQPRGGRALAASSSDVLGKADALYKGSDDRLALLNLLSAAVGADITRESPELLWRTARACHDVKKRIIADKIAPQDVLGPEGKPFADKASAVKFLATRAHELATEAVRRAPSDFAVQKWAGIALAGIGDIVGTKAKIGNAFTVREHFARAVELNPRDATSKYLLGQWCYDVASVSWLERRAAAAIFNTPPTCSFEEALAQFLEAEKCDPGFYVANALMVAKSYSSLGLKDDARKWATITLEMKAGNEDDRTAQKEARDLLAKL